MEIYRLIFYFRIETKKLTELWRTLNLHVDKIGEIIREHP